MPQPAQSALPRGHSFEGYRIESVLGTGGFGITYRAREIDLARRVAIKEYYPRELVIRLKNRIGVKPSRQDDAGGYKYCLKCFRDEAKVLVNFNHPNIVPVYRYFEANGTAYLVMPHIDGENLQARLERTKTLSEVETRSLLNPVLDGLEQVHNAGFLHHDIKPRNILIRSDGRPVLIDFGAARQILRRKHKKMPGYRTPGYSPIEQYSDKEKHGPWTDIYALGATLYRAISGEAPPEVLERAIKDTLVPAVKAGQGIYDHRLLTAIDRALAIEPGARPQNIHDLREMIQPGAGPRPRMLGAQAGAAPRREAQGDTLTASRAASFGVAPTGRRGRRVRVAGLAIAAGLVLAIAGTLVLAPDLVPLSRSKRFAAARASIAGVWCYEQTPFIQIRFQDRYFRRINRRLQRASENIAYKIVSLADRRMVLKTDKGNLLGRPSFGILALNIVGWKNDRAVRMRWALQKSVIAGNVVPTGNPEYLVRCVS